MDKMYLEIRYANLKSSYESGDKWLTLFISVMSIAFLSFVFTLMYKFIVKLIIEYSKLKTAHIANIMSTAFIVLVMIILLSAFVILIDLYYLRRQRKKRKELIMIDSILNKKEKR